MILTEIVDWLKIHEQSIQQLGNASLIILAITLIALPVVVMKLPENYFVKEKRSPSGHDSKFPLLWATLALLKNLLGILLILVGIAMLVLPGQGTLTILIGLSLTNFPGKFKLERHIVSHQSVSTALNKIRKLTGKPALLTPEG